MAKMTTFEMTINSTQQGIKPIYLKKTNIHVTIFNVSSSRSKENIFQYNAPVKNEAAL